MTTIQLDQVLLILGVALAANTIGGVGATVIAVLTQENRHGRAIAQRQREHQQEMADAQRTYQREKAALTQEIATLKGQMVILVQLLQARNVLTPGDAMQITSNRTDGVYTAMVRLFNKESLEILAADVGLSIEDIPDGGQPVVALRLMQEAQRLGKYDELVNAIQRARPNAVLT